MATRNDVIDLSYRHGKPIGYLPTRYSISVQGPYRSYVVFGQFVASMQCSMGMP